MYYYCISYLTSVNYYKKFQLFFVREKGITNTREKTAYHEAEKCMKKFKLSITIMAQEQKNLWNYVFFYLILGDDEEFAGEENSTNATQNETQEEMAGGEEAQSETNSVSNNDASKNDSPASKCSSPGSTASVELPNKSEILTSKEKWSEEEDMDQNMPESPTPSVKNLPTLRLNVALASDPAANPDAKEIKIKNEDSKSDGDEFMSNHDENSSTLDANNITIQLAKQHQILQSKAKVDNINNINPLINKGVDLVARPTMFMCQPCGIRFSSHSTLEAHQTYYCSHRKDADGNPIKPGEPNADNGEPPTKSVKTGKQYACTQCSYSADKKVSLNRHMRMHQTSPAPSSTASNGDDTPSQILAQQIIGPPTQQIIDRYCSDCDIRFSSTKTYRAHKQHYCSSRHREG